MAWCSDKSLGNGAVQHARDVCLPSPWLEDSEWFCCQKPAKIFQLFQGKYFAMLTYLWSVWNKMSSEHVNGLLVPENPGNANPFPHEDLSVKPPKVSTMSEWNKSCIDNWKLGEDCQAWTADRKQETSTARVDAFIGGGEWHGSRYNFIVLFVPQLLQWDERWDKWQFLMTAMICMLTKRVVTTKGVVVVNWSESAIPVYKFETWLIRLEFQKLRYIVFISYHHVFCHPEH